MKKLISLTLMVCLCLSLGVVTNAQESGTYVLMNIPYRDFYAAEGVAITDLDAVSSATMAKTRVPEQVGGSYHVNADGSDVTGVIFPVYVEDPSVLAGLGGEEITDDSSVVISVTLKGQETTTEYTGREALFEAPSYSWYKLPADEVPAQFKTLTVDGTPAFSALNASPVELPAEASFYFDSHIDLAIKVSGEKEALDKENVSAVILIADDGSRYAMEHSRNVHKKYDIGFNAFSDDNLADTQHIEFRYGEHLENMGNYSEGEYAYWLASGIQDGYRDKLIQTCIKLFVDENVGEAAEAA